MLLARVAFDLLRSPKFKQQVVAHIQKKLDELKVPDYINALQVQFRHCPMLLLVPLPVLLLLPLPAAHVIGQAYAATCGIACAATCGIACADIG